MSRDGMRDEVADLIHDAAVSAADAILDEVERLTKQVDDLEEALLDVESALVDGYITTALERVRAALLAISKKVLM